MASPSSTIQHLAYERSAGLLHSASAPSPFLPPRIAVHEKAFEIGSNCYSRQETKSPSCYPRSQGRRDAFDDTTQTRSLGKGNSKPRIPAGAIHWLGFPFFRLEQEEKLKGHVVKRPVLCVRLVVSSSEGKAQTTRIPGRARPSFPRARSPRPFLPRSSESFATRRSLAALPRSSPEMHELCLCSSRAITGTKGGCREGKNRVEITWSTLRPGPLRCVQHHSRRQMWGLVFLFTRAWESDPSS